MHLLSYFMTAYITPTKYIQIYNLVLMTLVNVMERTLEMVKFR